ncbi:hypothetical protein [Flavobacterium luminosum]|uniref:Uncharacterized protein n=1 Tax=Flavobacterium luminosum TaxID=2949086 RepID=A0ABT0TRI1_9FLAO|nr:hypothetical protein [Flavobacterium sp. HXWNR70]MCL9810114.1 hypothetical protein [Flavobacterium sp. HXWNR70]
MNILFFSTLLIFIILIINYFNSARKKSRLRLLTIFGILIGIITLGLNFLSNSCFGASTPIDVKTENLTKQNLKIYGITFWEDFGDGNGNYTHYDKELKPNETSEFCIDNDGGKFWLVAKNEKNEITYIKESLSNESNFEYKITNQNVEIEKAKIAKELTLKTDKSIELEKYLIWTNIILIGLLAISLLKK